jgi:hypothetical protein
MRPHHRLGIVCAALLLSLPVSAATRTSGSQDAKSGGADVGKLLAGALK